MPEHKHDVEATEPALSSSGNSSKTNFDTTQHVENASHRGSVASGARQASVTAKLRNPLVGLTEEQVLAAKGL
jgi:hypothetical protein